MYRQLVLFLLFICLLPSSYAETFDFLKSRKTINEEVEIEKIYFAEDSTNTIFTGNDKFLSSSFKEYSSEILEKGKTYWLKLTLKNMGNNKQEVYLIFNRFISDIQLYQFQKDSGYVKRIGGVLVPESKRSAKGFKKDKIPIFLEPKQLDQIYIRIYSDLEKAYDLNKIKLVRVRDFEKIVYGQNFLQGLFQGILLILLILNIFRLIYSRNILYLYYFLYLFFTSLFFLQFYQYTEKILFFDYPHIDLWLYKSLALNEFFFVLFFRQVMINNKIGIWSRFIDYYLRGSAVFVVAIFSVGIFDFYTSFILIDTFSFFNATIGILIFFVLFKKVKTSVRYILIGSMLMFIGGFISTFNDYSQTVAPHLYWYQLGIILELIFFTIAINHIFYEERLIKLKILYKNSLLEVERMQKEKETRELIATVDQNRRELANKTLMLFQNETLLTELIQKLTALLNLKAKKNDGIREMINSLQHSYKSNVWDEFEIHFNRIHPDFYKILHKEYPQLTPNEKRLCAFLKMNFSSKEISEITGQTLNSIDVARSRMRRKMNLPRNQTLTTVFDSLN